MSPALRTALERWLRDATSAEPSEMVQIYGLCWCIARYDLLGVTAELSVLLGKEFGPSDYPFGGAERYYDDKDARSMHKNHERLAWVRKMLGGEQ